VGKYLGDLLFAVDHHGQLLCSSCVLVLSSTEVLTVGWNVADWGGGGGVINTMKKLE
jgi:hypothetical protein